MPYDPTSHMIKAPVEYQDIRDCFGIDGDDIATLITNADVNKFSKFKPIISSVGSVAGFWDATNQEWIDHNLVTDWFRGNGSCGLSFSVFNTIGTLSNPNSFLYKLANGQLPWTYSKPTGGLNAKFREQDFADYFHDAEPPVGRLAGAGGTIYAPPSGEGTRPLVLNYDSPANPKYNLTLKDFFFNDVSFSDYYLAVVLIKGNRWICASSVNKISLEGSTLIETEIGYSDLGTWQVIPFISSVNINAYGEEQVGNYFSAGYDTPDTITIVSSTYSEHIRATGIYSRSDKTQIAFHCTLYNEYDRAVSHSNGVTISIYRTDDDASSGELGELVDQWVYRNAITIPASGSYSLPDTVYIAALDDYFCGTKDVAAPADGKMYWVVATFNDGTTIDNEWLPIEEGLFPE